MIQATPYLAFNGQAEEALTFYAQVFGGELKVISWDDAGQSGAEGVMHGQVSTDFGWSIMAADNPNFEGGDRPGNQRVTICVWGDEFDTMRSWFKQIADGGQITMPLEQQAWGDTFGGCIDRFGVEWGFNISGDQG